MDLQTILLSVIGLIITSLATWAVERLVAWLNTKIKDNKALQFMTDAISAVGSATKATYQAYVQALKDKDLFDEVAQKNALNIATEAALKNMSEESIKYIESNFGEIKEWIKLKIEATLYDLKKNSLGAVIDINE